MSVTASLLASTQVLRSVSRVSIAEELSASLDSNPSVPSTTLSIRATLAANAACRVLPKSLTAARFAGDSTFSTSSALATSAVSVVPMSATRSVLTATYFAMLVSIRAAMSDSQALLVVLLSSIARYKAEVVGLVT